ncbi:protein BANP-like [Schistocerca nitens]|uniref:protein BANP-like n=1 Tax=Schistocerca nitens TaxID=7011 RepID=UPI002117CAB6|nr:protein BANP-like [Schistocerca nitens]
MSVEPSVKRIRGEGSSVIEAIQTCCKYIADLKQVFNQRFSVLESKVGIMATNFNTLLQRMDALENLVKRSLKCDSHKHTCCEDVLGKIERMEEALKSVSIMNQSAISKDATDSGSESWSSPVVLVRNNKPAQVSASVGLDSTVQVITLNSENDYPDGSWLGDETNPESRVRCGISPANLLHINTFCHSPEKMAVTLLDYLFPREVLAVSNLSGKGKHGKKQLDPLMIYGIRCHLLHKFNITERDWYRIKQNMDSKCRTAWRKKVRGLPLGGFKNTSSNDASSHQLICEDGDPLIITSSQFAEDDTVEEIETQLIHTPEGDIKVLHATPEQLARLQEMRHVQVFSESLVVPVLHESSHILETEESDVPTDDSPPLTIVTSSGNVTLDVAEIARNNPNFLEAQDISMGAAQLLQAESEEENSENIMKKSGSCYIVPE